MLWLKYECFSGLVWVVGRRFVHGSPEVRSVTVYSGTLGSIPGVSMPGFMRGSFHPPCTPDTHILIGALPGVSSPGFDPGEV